MVDRFALRTTQGQINHISFDKKAVAELLALKQKIAELLFADGENAVRLSHCSEKDCSHRPCRPASSVF